jgi:hypothetical protein
LLLRVNEVFTPIDWKRYRELLAKRNAETISEAERMELTAISDQIETANARRIEYLAELARLRNTTVPALMSELGLQPTSHV